MSGIVRTASLALAVFAAPGFLFAADPPSTVSAIYLSYREPPSVTKETYPPPFLARELVRQAFLIAARDECGLVTRDSTLRETLASTPDLHVAAFEMFCTGASVNKKGELHYTLSRKTGTDLKKVWEWKTRFDFRASERIGRLAEKAEELSRGEFKDLLTGQLLGKTRPAARAMAEPPKDAVEALWDWNEIAVFAGLRRIQSEVFEKGESPELLGALAVGYANLGALTSYYCSPAHKDFSARGLLYAERLVHKTDKSAWALWHRAYVRAIVGLHALAAADVVAAKKSEKSADAHKAPFWSEIVSRFCAGDLAKMTEGAKSASERRLAAFLAFEASDYSSPPIVPFLAAQAVASGSEDCFRAWDAMCRPRWLGVISEITSQSFGRLSACLRKRLPGVTGLPAPLLRQLRDSKPPEKVADEVQSHAQLIANLKAAGRSAQDRSDPSLGALARMIEEIEFRQLGWRLQVESRQLALSTDDTVATFEPLVKDHRYGALIGAFSNRTVNILRAGVEALQKVDPTELGYSETDALKMLRKYDRFHGDAWVAVTYYHADAVFRDQMLGFTAGAAGTPQQTQYNESYVKALLANSSKLPTTVAVRIRRDWKHAQLEAQAMERDYKNDPTVIAALASRYLERKQFDDAERCLKEQVKLVPDYAGFFKLADLYKRKGDMVEWKKALEESMKLPSVSLERYKAEDDIAHYHMDRKEWKEAVVYADAAAESYAGWAMITASRCHEMLGEWGRSEELVKAASQRYDARSFQWLLWCHRTGRGDAGAAADCARAHFEAIGTAANNSELEEIAVFYLLTKEPDKALAVLQRAAQRGAGTFLLLQGALVADSLGKKTERDALLTQVTEAAVRAGSRAAGAHVYKELADAMRQSLSQGNVQDADLRRLGTIIGDAIKSKAASAAAVNYLVGLFLENRGARQGREFLVRCVQTDDMERLTHTLACQTLRDLRVKVPQASSAATAEKRGGR